MKRFLLLLVLSLWLSSCHSTEEKIIESVQTDKNLYDEFVKAAYQDKALLDNQGKYVKPKKLNAVKREKLDQLGIPDIDYIVLDRDNCTNGKDFAIEISFQGDWTLEYKPCESIPTVPGEHTEEGFIESWGINERWFLWVNNDFIG